MIDKMKYLTFEKSTYYSLIAFAFTLPLSRVALTFFLFWFLLLVLVKKDYKNSFFVLKDNKIFLYLGLFLSFILLSSIWSDDNERMISHITKFLYWFIIPCIVILMKPEWIYKVLNYFLLGMFISEILSYGIYFGFIDFLNGTPQSPSPFMNSINYSVFLAFTSLVLLYRFLYENFSFAVKFLLFIFFIMTTTNLLISTGRTGQLAFFITLFLVFIIKYRISIKTFFLSSIVFLFITIFSYNNIELFQKRVDSAISDIKNVVYERNFENSWGIRAAFWIVTYDAFKEQPIFGHGLGDYREVAKRLILEEERYSYLSVYVKDFMTTHRFHNQYLMLIIEGGILALIIFILFIYKLYNLNIYDKEMKHISIIGITVFMVAFIGDTLLYLKFPQGLFLLIISLAISSSRYKILNNN